MIMTGLRVTGVIVVGMGELQVTDCPSAVLTCLGLGSCVAVCAYEPVHKVGGMAHVVLPYHNGKQEMLSAKYADTAVPLLIQEMRKFGILASRLIVKIAGGAQMSAALGVNNIFKTGERNVAASKEAISKEGITLVAAETGGHYGRTVKMFIDTGKIVISSAGRDIKEI